MNILIRLFEKCGKIETLVKTIGYSSFLSQEKIKVLYHKLFKRKGVVVEYNSNALQDVFNYIKTLGIMKGDILIVHSSIEGMRIANPNPREIIDFLLELVGEEGTLVLPTFPIINLRHKPGVIQTYNPKRTLCWTGLLPNIFLQYIGVIRSQFPYNTLAALGKNSKEMMKNNLLSDTPHGENSAWKYCIDHHAKILSLGVKFAECNTMLHVVEDILGEEWPINEWYDSEEYNIKVADKDFRKQIKYCSSRWVNYNKCYNYNAMLRAKGLQTETVISGIIVGFEKDSNAIFEFMLSEARKGNIRYNIPSKYWKKYEK